MDVFKFIAVMLVIVFGGLFIWFGGWVFILLLGLAVAVILMVLAFGFILLVLLFIVVILFSPIYLIAKMLE